MAYIKRVINLSALMKITSYFDLSTTQFMVNKGVDQKGLETYFNE